ncbi:hypothetical protein J1N35_038753 [Gossypium stocksii]|uniref:CCHC-type domain-containing protein n=1 Tax=Gossypium stocksii TaxID=47602 RepID=A0A9D3UPG2_9ROSI|nr:hypothetical protein J1N35_038753 [Gossypium stocksii]
MVRNKEVIDAKFGDLEMEEAATCKNSLKTGICQILIMEGFTQCIEYEGLLTICYACGYYDHAKEHCKKEGTNDQASQDSMTTGNEEVHEKNSI